MVLFRIGLIALALAGIAHSQTSFAGDAAAAEALFRSAREAADQGDWVTACDRFEESKRLEPVPGTILNLARCREKLGQIASAWKSYEEAAQRMASNDDRVAFARRKVDELSERVPRLTLLPPAGDTEITVIIRDTEYAAATFGVELPFDPGELTILVRASGHEDQVAKLEMVEGESIEHQLIVGPAVGEHREDPAPVTDAAPAVEDSGRRIMGYSFIGVGGVGLAAAIGGGIWAGIELQTVNDEENCPTKGECNQVGADAAARGRTAVIVTAAGSVLAAVGLGFGTYFLLTPREGPAVAFTPLPGGAMLSLRKSL